MEKYQAINLVEEEVNKHHDPRDAGSIEVIRDLTRERSYGWIFFVNTQRYNIAKEDGYNANGFGPVVFLIADRSIHNLQSYLDPDTAITDFEKKSGLAD